MLHAKLTRRLHIDCFSSIEIPFFALPKLASQLLSKKIKA
jgi:hypothetical protein